MYSRRAPHDRRNRFAPDPTLITTAEQLQQTLHEHIPISVPMGIEVRSFDGSELVLTAPLEPNVNVHGTAFAGSIYAVGALTGWSMMTLQLGLAGIDGSLVIASANISYRRPVTGAIVARCQLPGDGFEASLERLRERGRARFELTTTIGAADEPDARLDGNYAVRVAS